MLRLLYISSRLELGVDDDVHGVLQRVAEMQFYAQVVLLYQMEAGAVALVGGKVETEEGVAVSVVAASQSVPLVLPHLAGRGEQTHVAPDEEVVFGWKGLEGICRPSTYTAWKLMALFLA